MIFRQIDEIKSGRKTQTRRVVQQGDSMMRDKETFVLGEPPYVIRKGRLHWQVGRDYALVPKRGQKAVGRIRLTGIRCEALQLISEADARAEGVENVEAYRRLWESINTRKGTRWSDNPLVWVCEFEYIPDNGD